MIVIAVPELSIKIVKFEEGLADAEAVRPPYSFRDDILTLLTFEPPDRMLFRITVMDIASADTIKTMTNMMAIIEVIALLAMELCNLLISPFVKNELWSRNPEHSYTIC